MIYKKQDIDRAFTEAVARLIGQGYQINLATMSGSQGEIAHVDLCKGDEILRVRLEQCNGYGTVPDYLSLTVGRCTESLRNDTLERGETIWNNSLEILTEIKYFSTAWSLYDSQVYMDMASALEAQEKHIRREEARKMPSRKVLPEAFKSPALRWLRKQKGLKNCRLDEIESVTRVNQQKWGRTLPALDCYEIKARGRNFYIRLRKPA